MANETTTLLIDVQVSATEALKRQQELKIAIDEQKKALQQLEVEQGKTSQAYIAEEAILKNLNNQLAANGRVLAQMAGTTTTVSGAYAQLNQQSAQAAQRAKDLAAAYGTNDERSKMAAKSAKELSDRLKEIDSSVGQNQRRVGDYAGEMGKLAGAFGSMPGVLGKMGGAVDTATTGFQAMNAASPVGWIQIAIQVIGGLIQKFSSFAPVSDAITNGLAKMTAAFDVLKNGVIAVVTGQKSLSDVLSGATGEMTKQIAEAERLAEAQRDLEDRTEASTVSQAKYANQVNELILQSKNRTLSEKERIALIDKALAIEGKAFKERKSIVDDEVKMIQDKLIKEGGLNAYEAQQLRKKGVSYARYKENQKNLDDQTIKDLAAALVKQQQIEGESISLREKAMNRREQLMEAAAVAEEKRNAKAIATREKLTAAQQKADAEKLAADKKAEADRVKALKEKADAEIEALNYAIEMEKLKQEERLAGQKLTDEQLYNDKQQALIDNSNNEAAILEAKLLNEQITQEEFNAQQLLLNQKLKTDLAISDAEYETKKQENKKIAAATDLQNEYAIQEMKGASLYELKLQQLDADYQAELLAAQKTGADTLLIEQKYSEAKKQLAQAETAAKMDIASNFAGNIAEIFGKNTKVGKMAASAQIAVDTAKGAMAAYTSTASIPIVGVPLGIAAAGAVIAKGARSIKDVWAVKSGLPGDGGGGGASVPNSVGGSVASITGGLVSRSSGQTQQAATSQAVDAALKANPSQPVLVTNDLTTALNQQVQLKNDNSL